MNPDAARYDNQPVQVKRSETVAAKESPIPTPNSEETESLTVRYAELLRLRQEVRQAEARTVPHPHFGQPQTNRNHRLRILS
jgi:hypothetical protein